MKKAPIVILVLFFLLAGAVIGASAIFSYLQTTGPTALVGTYTVSGVANSQIEVTERGGGYFVKYGTPQKMNNEVPLIPMQIADQDRFGGSAVNANLVGLRSAIGDFMLFKVNPGYQNWGVTFPSGYGCWGGFAPGLAPLEKK